jgi:hypothetical protein
MITIPPCASWGALILALLSLIPISLEGQSKRDGRWQRLDEAGSPSMWVDTRTVDTTSEGRRYRLWLKLKLDEAEKDPDGKPYNSLLDREEIDCHDRRSKSVQVIRYDASGAVVSQYKFQDADWEDPVPGTIGESMIDLFCAAIKQPWIPEVP